MKVAIFLPKDAEEETYVSISEMDAYIELLKEHGVISYDGDICKVESVRYDAHTHVMEITCAEE